jgi:uncharacterized OsmC-like protein
MHIEMEQLAGRRFAIRARGNEVIVDDTLEAGGPGDGFRPSELLMGALAACMSGTMLNFARNQKIEIDAITVRVEDETFDHPDRIGRLTIQMHVGAEANEGQLASLRRVASACKIHNTLERSPEMNLEFRVGR